MDIQSLRAGFFGGGGNVTALVENGGLWRTIADSFLRFQTVAVHVTRRSYKTLSGATLPFLSFLQLWILVYRQSNRTGLRVPLAVLVPRLTESLTNLSAVFTLAAVITGSLRAGPSHRTTITQQLVSSHGPLSPAHKQLQKSQRLP